MLSYTYELYRYKQEICNYVPSTPFIAASIHMAIPTPGCDVNHAPNHSCYFDLDNVMQMVELLLSRKARIDGNAVGEALMHEERLVEDTITAP